MNICPKNETVQHAFWGILKLSGLLIYPCRKEIEFPATLLLFYLLISGSEHNGKDETSCISSEDVQDPMKKKKARNMVRTKFEERYKSGKNR